jgi:hypothetical protein
MEAKKIYKSKLVWIGAITFIYGLLQIFGVVEAELTEGLIDSILGFVVILLRYVTKEEVVLK